MSICNCTLWSVSALFLLYLTRLVKVVLSYMIAFQPAGHDMLHSVNLSSSIVVYSLLLTQQLFAPQIENVQRSVSALIKLLCIAMSFGITGTLLPHHAS